MKPNAPPEELLSLFRLLNSHDFDTRIEALEALLEYGKPYSLISARAMCQDANETIRNTAIEALGDFGSQRMDSRRVIAALQDTSWIVRASAATSLGQLGGKLAFKHLVSALQDRHEVVRRDAAYALGRYGTAARQPLEDALSRETNERVLIGVHYGLFRAGEREAMRAYLDFLRSDDFLARSNVVNGINPEDLSAQEAEMVAKSVMNYLGTEDNPGNKGDALSLLTELREYHQTVEQSI